MRSYRRNETFEEVTLGVLGGVDGSRSCCFVGLI